MYGCEPLFLLCFEWQANLYSNRLVRLFAVNPQRDNWFELRPQQQPLDKNVSCGEPFNKFTLGNLYDPECLMDYPKKKFALLGFLSYRISLVMPQL